MNAPDRNATCADRIADYMAGRAETIAALYAADEDCAFTLDGRDTDDNFGADEGGTPWYRCSTHDKLSMGSTDDGEPRPPDFPCEGWHSDEDGYALGDEGAQERLNELPLSVEVIRHIKVLLGTGGPADWLDAQLDSEGDITTLTYHFADWGDHAQTYVEKDSPLWRFAESFGEVAELATDYEMDRRS